jgi:plasmid stability protein
MPDVLIRKVPKKTLDSLKRKAAQHGRSLQQELRLALERLSAEALFDFVEHAREIRQRIARYAPQQTDSALLVREDRQR